MLTANTLGGQQHHQTLNQVVLNMQSMQDFGEGTCNTSQMIHHCGASLSKQHTAQNHA